MLNSGEYEQPARPTTKTLIAIALGNNNCDRIAPMRRIFAVLLMDDCLSDDLREDHLF
jgi:hypothetical protein